MLPVVPPTEDFQVGDVYVRRLDDRYAQADHGSAFCSEAPRGFAPLPVLLASLSGTSRSLKSHYGGERLSLPATAASSVSIDSSTGRITVSPKTSQSTDSIFRETASPTGLTRLRQVAFPDFMAASVSGFELAAFVPIHSVLSDVGLGYEAVESASVSLPSAEGYGLPASQLLELLDLNWVKGEGAPKGPGYECRKIPGVSFDVLLGLVGEGATGSNVDSVLISVVQQVFLARAIDSTITFKRSAVAGLNRDQSSASSPSGRFVPYAPASGVQAGAVVPSDPSRDISMLATALAQAFASRNGVPGVTLSVRSTSTGSISLRRVLDQPVVVGYRSIDFRVSRNPKSSSDCVDLRLVTDRTAGPIAAPASAAASSYGLPKQ